MTETVLVVDDDPEFRAYMAEALARHGYTVHTARNGRDAVSLAETAFFDLIVTDVYMPEADKPIENRQPTISNRSIGYGRSLIGCQYCIFRSLQARC